ncbi:hypothetical protein [Serratia proteamaculans]|uniref:hypothetical protein n=1 Tax=Serratia proteamaculans TaxID=28151 RepID=UPI000A14765E|nr:hypothetical protein [Serratia proteamaculans]
MSFTAALQLPEFLLVWPELGALACHHDRSTTADGGHKKAGQLTGFFISEATSGIFIAIA